MTLKIGIFLALCIICMNGYQLTMENKAQNETMMTKADFCSAISQEYRNNYGNHICKDAPKMAIKKNMRSVAALRDIDYRKPKQTYVVKPTVYPTTNTHRNVFMELYLEHMLTEHVAKNTPAKGDKI